MRYYKDSFALINPREYYWNDQYINQKRYLARVLSIKNLQKDNLVGILNRNFIAFFYQWNRVQGGTHVYLPKSKRLTLSPHWWVFLGGFFLASFLHAFEARLWKERKWDREPGTIVPIRKPLFTRLYLYYVHMKWKVFIFYHGYWMNNKDLSTIVTIEEIYQGRPYKKALAMEYAYKEKRIKMRDDRYDFLDLSPKHGLVIS